MRPDGSSCARDHNANEHMRAHFGVEHETSATLLRAPCIRQHPSASVSIGVEHETAATLLRAEEDSTLLCITIFQSKCTFF